MKYRETELFHRKDLGASGTEIIDINLADPVSCIEVLWSEYVHGNMRAQPASAISKLELVDGSDVLFAMSGLEAQGLNIYDRKANTMNGLYHCAGNHMYTTMAIDFGRRLWDPELAFDPTKFRNPQLKVTYDETLPWADSTENYLEVFAKCFDEKVISPIGFLMGKQHHEYTPSAENEYETIDLPTDYPIRQMIIRPYLVKKDPLDVVDEARLSEDNLKRIVFDMNLIRYVERMSGVWTPVTDYFYEYGTVAEDTYDKYFAASKFGACLLSMAQETWGEQYFVNAMRGGWSDRQDNKAIMNYGIATGYLPNHCIQIPFGNQDDLDDWYDVTAKGSVQLRLLSGSEYSGSVVSTILQQLRRY